MAGIYFHIPFCRQKCHYCNFFSVASRKGREEVITAMLRELELQRAYLCGETIQTIYFGGGTPSLFSPAVIGEFIQSAGKYYRLCANPEITIEANPDDVNDEWLHDLPGTGVNRLSIGVQSFSNDDLRYLHRNHNGTMAEDAVKKAFESGFENVSIDLIYGIPTLSDRGWCENLDKAIRLRVPHISAYALTVEQGTALDHLIRKGKFQPVDEEKTASQFISMIETLDINGYQHYEISNFCLAGHISRHNSAYWTGEKYLGIGPSAHSYDGTSRQWNISRIGEYLSQVAYGNIKPEKELLSPIRKFNEYIMTSLRTMWGIDLELIRTNYGQDYFDHIQKQIPGLLSRGLLSKSSNKIILTPDGKLFADRIASDLFLIDE